MSGCRGRLVQGLVQGLVRGPPHPRRLRHRGRCAVPGEAAPIGGQDEAYKSKISKAPTTIVGPCLPRLVLAHVALFAAETAGGLGRGG